MKTNPHCRMCGSRQLTKFLDLGESPLANSFLTTENLQNNKEEKYPLRVFFCEDCNLSQLTDVISPELLFKDYVYFSSGMPVLPAHFRNYALEVKNNFLTSTDQLVVELGSNDGILIGAIKDLGARVLGVDPAENIAKIANTRGIETIPAFFSESLAQEIRQKHGPAQVIIGNNVVAHIDNHHDLMRGVAHLLDDKGVFIIEAPYLVDMFENLTFDTIYHEHLSYLSIHPLQRLLSKFGLEIFDVKVFPMQGVSLRMYADKKNTRPIEYSVQEFLNREDEFGLHKLEKYRELALKVSQLKRKVIATLQDLKSSNKKISAYGAPAKGNTLLNYFGIGHSIIDYATEALPSKIGLYTPGTHIPIIDIEQARKNPPDYYLMLAWNYKDAILAKEKNFREKGGKFIIPVGDVEII